MKAAKMHASNLQDALDLSKSRKRIWYQLQFMGIGERWHNYPMLLANRLYAYKDKAEQMLLESKGIRLGIWHTGTGASSSAISTASHSS